MSQVSAMLLLITLAMSSPLRAERVTGLAAVSLKDAMAAVEKQYETAHPSDDGQTMRRPSPQEDRQLGTSKSRNFLGRVSLAHCFLRSANFKRIAEWASPVRFCLLAD